MPRTQGTAVSNNFSAGFITEATGLNFPPNSCTETLNCIHEQTGNVSRRLGIDIEANRDTRQINRDGDVIASYLWKNVAGSATLQLVVIQIGHLLYFYDASTTDPLSTHAITDTVSLNTFDITSEESTKSKECQFADGNGLLFVVHPECDPFYVSYDENTQTFTSTRITLKIRDLKGLEDNLEVDERPESSYSGLSTEKKYNLFNQGWTIENLTTWDSARTDMPSNADIMWRYKNASDDFDTNTIDKLYSGNSPAPRGRYILELFDQDRGDVSDLTIDPEVLSTRPRTVAFHAGRVFYAGINAEGYNSKIYFSQIVERPSQYGLAYQINDPTSETLFDLLPTDGGFIDIRECGNIVKLYPQGSGLVVFATNGVWLISGSTGLGFTANDYSVVKIAETAALTSSSFVEVRGQMTWWNLEGIQLLQLEGSGGKVTSLTEAKIKSYYNTIPPSAKRRASGFYNTVTGIVQWLYRVEEPGTVEELYETQQIMNFNVNTGAFYIWEPYEEEIKIHCVFVTEHTGGDITEELVVDDDDEQVQDENDVDVVVYTIENSITEPKFRYFVTYPRGAGGHFATFAEAWDVNYVDWETYLPNGQDYSSYFITGYSVAGEGNKEFQNNYVTFHSDTNSIYDVQARWDWSNSGDSGKWGTTQRIDTTPFTNYTYMPRRLKVRGQGKALQIKVTATDGNPFDVSGWITHITGNTAV